MLLERYCQVLKNFCNRDKSNKKKNFDILKVIKSLHNRGILLKGTTRKMTSQGGGFFNFLKPLISAVLALMKSVLTPLAKNVLIPLELTAAFLIKYNIINNFK